MEKLGGAGLLAAAAVVEVVLGGGSTGPVSSPNKDDVVEGLLGAAVLTGIGDASSANNEEDFDGGAADLAARASPNKEEDGRLTALTNKTNEKITQTGGKF